MQIETAREIWSRLDSVKQPLIQRVERYASLTIPKVLLPEGFQPESTDQTHDFQSIGAQAVNHVVNKLIMALFRPSQPFFRLQVGAETKKELAAANITEVDISAALADTERNACRELDGLAQRPKLYLAARNLVIAGNVLVEFKDNTLRILSLRYFCVKRNIDGSINTLVIREKVKFDELMPDVQAALPPRKYQPETEVEFFKLLQRDARGDMRLSQWVDDTRLDSRFDGKWKADVAPYRVITWDLADESDYGTGLVEEYAGDFEALSVLAEAVVDGAVLGCEIRWLVNPSGQTSADDFNASKNGDALSGVPADIQPTQGGNPNAVKIALDVSNRYEQRIARGFLMGSAMTRDAERVTAEEIRLVANELETSFGGVYSALAANIQEPVARWLLDRVGASIQGKDLRVMVVSGLDALSRNSDLEALRLALGDLGQIAMLPQELQARLNMSALAAFIGQGRGVALEQFIKSEEQVQQEQQAQAQSRVAEQSAVAAGEAAAQQGVE